MASEETQAFNKGFASLMKQMKDNREAEEQQIANNFNIEMNKLTGDVTRASNERAKLEKKLSDIDENDKKSLNEINKLLKENEKRVALAQEAKTQKLEEIKTAEDTKDAMMKMRNLTEEQVLTEKEQIAEIADMKAAQKAYQEEYEKTEGAKATDSKSFNKMNLDIAQKELNMRKEAAKRDGISKAGQEEIDKEQKRINTERGTVFGKMSNYMMDMSQNIKKVIGTAGKGLLGGAIFLAIGAFLQSEFFQKIVDLIFDEIIPGIQNFYENTLKPFATGIMTFFQDPTFENFKKIFDVENPLGLVVGLAGIVALLAPGLMFKGLKGGIKLLGLAFSGLFGSGGKDGVLDKDNKLKGRKGMLKRLGGSITKMFGAITAFGSTAFTFVKDMGAKALDSAKAAGAKLAEKIGALKKSATDLAKKGLENVKNVATKTVTAAKNVAGSVAGGAKNVATQTAGVASKAATAIKGTGSTITASAAKAFKAFPRLGIAAKLVPGLGAALAAGQGIAILMDDSMSKDDKIKAFGGLLGGALGSAGFAALGAALGTAVFPGVGTIGGGLLGGVLGYFGGDYAGRKAAKFLLGEQTEEEKVAQEIASTGGADFASQGDTSGGYVSDATVGGTTDMDVGQGSSTANQKFVIGKRKPSESMIAARVKAGMSREDAERTPETFRVPIGGDRGGTTIIQNAPQNNNSVSNSNTTAASSGFVEPDPMFRRNAQYAI